jgi:hypothetical protein
MTKTRISLGLMSLVTIITLNSCKKGEVGPTGAMGIAGAPGPKDPNFAPKTQVDRFSSLSGTLMVRNSMNGLPAANAPVNFDQAPFITMGKTPSGLLVEYYNFDARSTVPAPIYVLFRAGDSNPVIGQKNIVNVKPGDSGYNDFWQVNKVTVPASYVANTITSYASLVSMGYAIAPTTMLVNCPVVPEGSTATKRFINEPGSLVQGWYKDSILFYFSFEEKALFGTSVPTSPIYVTFNVNPPSGGPSSGFVVEPGTTQTHNILGSIPSDASFSPLWSVNVYDNANFSAVMNLNTAQSATILATGVALVNCPIVLIK